MITTAQHNVVIVAKSFNPTIFSQLWLTKHEVFSLPEVEGGNFVYTPMAVSLTTQDISFLAVAERIQLSFLSETVNHSKEINRILAKIVKALPHTPFEAVGFNFVWALPAKDKSQFTEINRKFFLSKENPIAHDFASEDCRFGSYFSKNVPIGRLRLEIRPISHAETEGLQLAFNFNRELQEGESQVHISEFLTKWDDASGIANGMRNAIGDGWTQS